ncbi:MAG: hypothetical protein AAFX87_06505 [Bacteroidota bacterium]
MQKVKPENYKGIEYVRMVNLPEEQRVAIADWLTEDTLIKILRDNIILRDCVQYSDYTFWLENIFNVEEQQESIPQSDDAKVGLDNLKKALSDAIFPARS